VRTLLAAALATLLFSADAAAQVVGPEDGHQVFETWCAPCHAPGPGHPGTQALEAKYKGARPAPLEDRRDLTADQVRYYVRHGVSIMPFFRKTEISDAELDALAAYLSQQHR
jgi:mono/diheme cytochrome c family protein